ncbi:MAG: glycosyltransferase [Candidatus Omnitrophica bacterium]|nr:glycosyltransferase [Candidatus Omnitrophota bacterium]
MNAKFSYIIPFYNSKDTLYDTLDSVIKNDGACEIILIDDCSTDDTKGVIDSLLLQHNNIQYIRNSLRLGAGLSRNIGAGVAQGDILVFLDSDVIIPPNSKKVIGSYFLENKVTPKPDALVANRSKESPYQDTVSSYKNYWTSFNLSKLNGWTYLIFSSFFAIKKEVFVKVGGFRNISFAEDNDFGYRINADNYKIYFARELIAAHKKNFSVLSLLKREFKAGREGIKVKIRNRVFADVIKNKKFFVVNESFVYTFPFAITFSLSVLIGIWSFSQTYFLISLLSLSAIVLINLEFLGYASCSRNYIKGISYILLMVVQLNTIGLGMLFGFFELLISKVYSVFLSFLSFLNSFLKIFFKNLLPPEQITFFITNRCNLKCSHCFVDKSNTQANVEELTPVEIDQFSKNMGRINFITITGGEPFLREDIVDIVTTLNKNLKPLLITLLTNGEMREVVISRLNEILARCQNKNILVKISLDGPREVHDRMRLKTGAFENTIATFNELKKMKMAYPNLSLGIITTYTPENKAVIERFYDEVITNLSPDQYGLSLERPETANELNKDIDINEFLGVYERVHRKMLPLSHGFFRKFRLAYKIRMADKLKQIYFTRKYPMKCFAGRVNAVISPKGDVFACEQLKLKLGNLSEAAYRWKRLWHSPCAKKIRNFIDDNLCFCTNECYIPFNISYDLKELLGVIGFFFRVYVFGFDLRSKASAGF